MIFFFFAYYSRLNNIKYKISISLNKFKIQIVMVIMKIKQKFNVYSIYFSYFCLKFQKIKININHSDLNL